VTGIFLGLQRGSKRGLPDPDCLEESSFAWSSLLTGSRCWETSAIMRCIAIITFLLLATSNLSAFSASVPAKRSYSTHDYYVLEHDPGLSLSLQECADALSVEIVEQVGELENHWLVRTPNGVPSRRSLGGDLVLRRLAALRRTGRSTSPYLQLRSPSEVRRLARAVRSLEPQTPRLRTKKRAPTPFPGPAPPPLIPTKADRIALELGIVDPTFHDQWHLANPDYPAYDLNVSGLWSQGVTGKGVYVAVVDDGLDSTSDDLAANFVSLVMNVYVSGSIETILYRTWKDHGISMTTPTFPHLDSRMINMEPAVVARLLLSKMTFVGSGSLMIPRLLAYVFYLGLYQMPMKLLRLTTATTRHLFTPVAGGPLTTGSPWTHPLTLSKRPSSMASTKVVMEKVLSLSSQVEMGPALVISAILMDTRIPSTP
jgi:hypothetical protein